MNHTQPIPQFSMPEELALAIEEAMTGDERPLIGIDGLDGVGKGALAERLGTLLSGTVVGLDDVLVDRGDEYLEALDLKSLEGVLNDAFPPCIVVGVCLLEALARLALRPTVLVYVKRVGPLGVWYDEAICESPLPVTELVARERASRKVIADLEAYLGGEGGEPGLTQRAEEVVLYHARYCPSRRADFIYHWPGGS